MRLLFVHDHRFYRGADGELHTAGSFPASVWQRYLRHFDEITVLARDGGPLPAGSSLAVSNHPQVSFAFAPSLSSLRQLLLPSREADAQISAEVHRADAVVARVPSELGLRAMKTARRLHKPYAAEVVGCAWDGFVHHGSFAARLYAPLLFQRMRRAVSGAPQVLYVTSKWLQHRYPNNNFKTFASNVEIVPLDPESSRRRQERLARLAAGEPPRLGTVAALTMKTKGVQTAIAAIARLRTEGSDFNYAVLGPGDPKPWQAVARSAGVEDLVQFDGTREAGAGVREWLDGIDVHLQPSFQEGLPRATIEAMSRGVACIGSSCGGIPELLSPDRTHSPGDVAGLARSVARLAGDPLRIADTSRADLEMAENYLPEILQARRDEFYGHLRRNAVASCAAKEPG